MGDVFQYQLLMAGALTAILIYRCCYACEKQRRPTRLYRRVGDEDDSPVESIIYDTARRPQRQETPPPEWDFDVRPPRAPCAFAGPAVHGACRAPTAFTTDATLVTPPPYSVIAIDAPTIGGPPPTYQEVVDLQRQENANRASDA